jgi:hypothetical protein
MSRDRTNTRKMNRKNNRRNIRQWVVNYWEAASSLPGNYWEAASSFLRGWQEITLVVCKETTSKLPTRRIYIILFHIYVHTSDCFFISENLYEYIRRVPVFHIYENFFIYEYLFIYENVVFLTFRS